jgi:1,4-alpha-glucan branching enzyme
MYAFSEEYILPISHDEVTHGIRALIEKMPGSYEDKFAGIRALMGYMMSHPGKKLHFMGSEIGQFTEWDHQKGIEFFLKEYPTHDKYNKMIQTLNALYKDYPALYEIEDSWKGFAWLAPDDESRNFLAYQRTDRQGNTIIVMINFSGADLLNYTLGVPEGKYKVIFNSDSTRFGGEGKVKKNTYHTANTYSHGRQTSITFDLPKLTCVYLEKINS